jgi:hypothetical protein
LFQIQPHPEGFGNWPWETPEENGKADPKYRYNLTSLRFPRFVIILEKKD